MRLLQSYPLASNRNQYSCIYSLPSAMPKDDTKTQRTCQNAYSMIKSTYLHPFSSLRTLLFVLCLWMLASHTQAQSIRPLSDRLDAIVSYPLVIAIMVEDERDLRSGVIAKLDDGRIMQCQAYWVGISPQNTLPSWTSPAGIWTATDYKAINKLEQAHRPTGTWFIEIPMPIDAVGQGLWITGERYELNWLPDPSRTRLEAAHAGDEQSLLSLWSLKLTDQAREDPAVQAAIEHYRLDPFQHWRMRLLTDGLNPDHQTQTDRTTLMPSNLSWQWTRPEQISCASLLANMKPAGRLSWGESGSSIP